MLKLFGDDYVIEFICDFLAAVGDGEGQAKGRQRGKSRADWMQGYGIYHSWETG